MTVNALSLTALTETATLTRALLAEQQRTNALLEALLSARGVALPAPAMTGPAWGPTTRRQRKAARREAEQREAERAGAEAAARHERRDLTPDERERARAIVEWTRTAFSGSGSGPDDEPLDAPALHAEPCLVCGAPGACAYDAEGRPLIHADDDEEDYQR